MSACFGRFIDSHDRTLGIWAVHRAGRGMGRGPGIRGLAAVSAGPAHRDLRLRSGGAPLAHSDGQLKDVS